MIDRDFDLLMQDVLDGQASPEDVERLKVWLARSEEGRARMRELEGVFAALGKVPFAEMPAGLENEVERAIRARATSQETVLPQARAWGAKPRMRLAMVFAAGIVAGVIGWGALTGILNPEGAGRERMVGAMIPTTPPRTGTLSRTWKTGETRLEAVVWRAGKSRWLRLHVEGQAPAEVELTFDPTDLSPAAVRQSDPSARVVLNSGRISIRVAPRGDFTFELGEKATAGSIHVTARSGDQSISDELPSP